MTPPTIPGTGTTLAQRIRRLRDALGLSQSQFAQRVGSGYAVTVSRWETEQSAPDRARLHLMASLTQRPDKVYVWLVEGGPEPKLAPSITDKPGAMGTLLAAPPPLPPESVLTEDVSTQRRSFATLFKRVVALAAAGKLIRAHHLIGWATMLQRISDLLAVVTKRFEIVVRESPILILELDMGSHIVGYHAGQLNHNDDRELHDALMGRPISEILPQIPSGELQQALIQARRGEDAEFAYTIPFNDSARAYNARLYLIGGDNVMLFVQRAGGLRTDELGIRKRAGLGG